MKTTTKISDNNKEFDKTKIKSQQDTKIYKKPRDKGKLQSIHT